MRASRPGSIASASASCEALCTMATRLTAFWASLPSRRAIGRQQMVRLTRRELEVLRLVAEGYTDREVAEMLVISPRTANRHLSNIFVKLDVPGRAAAVAYAIRQGMV